MARRSKENAIDWDAIERQYRLGQKSNKQLAEEFEVQPSSIGRRAEKYGWVQDKRKEVEDTTNSLLIQNASGKANPNATPNALDVKIAAQVAADIVIGHRSSLKRQGAIEERLFAALEDALDAMPNMDAFTKALFEACRDDPLRLGDALKSLNKLAGRSQLIDDFKRLVETSDRRQLGERRAFNIGDTDGDGKGGVEDMLKRLGERGV